MVKRLPAMRETRVRSLGGEDLLEKGMATHSSIAWRIPWIAWWATLHGVAKSWTQLSDFTFTFYALLLSSSFSLGLTVRLVGS